MTYGLSSFLFYGFNNLIYWLYSFKQYSIAVTVPILQKKAAAKEPVPEFYREHLRKKNNKARNIGITVNFILVTLLSIDRYFLILKITPANTRDKLPPFFDISDIILNALTELFLLVSASVLFVALKKFNGIFDSNKRF